MSPLTDKKVRSVKLSGPKQKFADGGGLMLEVVVSGTRSWRLRYPWD